ncbi:hypothetical protein RGU12_01705 [Fredinandcohnia sp. QZ13]|uniref:hypothetical protein n=1 Tax=Fredinandcohnia sp. QZ13 TaxID=3073144 RepID=UPI0028532064|nr:hypothetical protein [Fredinandcohnia sp. QZ13]MDR4886260.1 hypothetical protein [Fredinandcohnia sp. QZ13]
MDLNKFKYYMNLVGLSIVIASTYLHIVASITNQLTIIGAAFFTFNWVVTLLFNDVFWEYINKWMGK